MFERCTTQRDVRLAAAGALDGLDHDDTVTALIGAIQDSDDEIRQTAIELARRSSQLSGSGPSRGGDDDPGEQCSVTGLLDRLGAVR